ncbi:hypothetical protein [Paenibacillus aceris]|uniref:Uncharacterized protein n=1 Tax=Paenibacillus aceris TaxID=869555 RepID=A0ABS4I5G1_9BACL|nr:hypothetical protein [Paenibacillus aceris]MBP1966153.1 hypothetical protein [Paenibacillus aceris]NHW33310.1 hypothetical protein [Paenibacillus aceris]
MEKKIQLIELLCIDDLPQPHSSWSEIFYLASSFLAYKYWGSFEKAAEISDKVELEFKSSGNLVNCDLIELRTELFMIARGCHHSLGTLCVCVCEFRRAQRYQSIWYMACYPYFIVVNCTYRVLPNLVLDTTGEVVDSINGMVNTKRGNISLNGNSN